MTRSRTTAIALLVAYLGSGAAILLSPGKVDAPIDGQLFTTLAWLHAHGAPSGFNYAFVEATANVIFFLPLGLLLTVMLGRRLWWVAPVVGFAASAGAELTQYFFLPGRVASVQDVVMNTSGALIGTVLVLAIRLVRSPRASTYRVVPFPTTATPAAATSFERIAA